MSLFWPNDIIMLMKFEFFSDQSHEGEHLYSISAEQKIIFYAQQELNSVKAVAFEYNVFIKGLLMSW